VPQYGGTTEAAGDLPISRLCGGRWPDELRPPSFSEAYHQFGIYAARILSGAKPADLPVMQSDKFEFVINLKVAKTLGVTFSGNLLSLADEVIE
jgi:hypothetical protein